MRIVRRTSGAQPIFLHTFEFNMLKQIVTGSRRNGKEATYTMRRDLQYLEWIQYARSASAWFFVTDFSARQVGHLPTGKETRMFLVYIKSWPGYICWAAPVVLISSQRKKGKWILPHHLTVYFRSRQLNVVFSRAAHPPPEILGHLKCASGQGVLGVRLPNLASA